MLDFATKFDYIPLSMIWCTLFCDCFVLRKIWLVDNVV